MEEVEEEEEEDKKEKRKKHVEKEEVTSPSVESRQQVIGKTSSSFCRPLLLPGLIASSVAVINSTTSTNAEDNSTNTPVYQFHPD